MKNITVFNEFRTEAKDALFTKQQAVAVTLRLLQTALSEANEDDKKVISKALETISFSYLDSTATRIDDMLDEVGVARFTSEQIIEAINNVIFDVK